MNDKFLAVLMAIMLPSISFGQDPQNYQCTNGDLQRRVEILYEAGVTVPCEVHYYKDTEAPGERQVLWRASNESGYCERKTQEFIVKLQGLGWNCGQDDDVEREQQRSMADLDDFIANQRANILSYRSRIAALQHQAADLERGGRKVPKDILDTLATLGDNIAEAEQTIATRQQHKKDIQQADDLEQGAEPVQGDNTETLIPIEETESND